MNRKFTAQSRSVTVSASVLLAVAIAGCGVSDKPESEGSFDSVVSADVREAIASEPTVELADGGAISQRVHTRIAHRVIEEMGGSVETVTMDQFAALPAMGRNEHLVFLEVWDIPNAPQIKQYVEDEKVAVDLGETGPAAREGWYFPTYVMEGDPERGIEPMCPGLPDYQALNDCVDVFATSSTGDKGRFLSGDPAWKHLYGDPQRIKNLGLNYEIEFAGSEAALSASFKRAYERGEPILGLNWEPNWVTSKYDLTMVEFPEYTDECWGTTYACGWGEMTLRIIASSRFPEVHPTATAMLENFEFTNDDLGEMLLAIEEDGLSVEEAVEAWMVENQDIWTAWIPETTA